MSGYQTILQLSALAGFWGAYASHAVFPSSSALQWQIPVAIQLVPGILLLIGTVFIPETPRFLAEKERFVEAETSLAWLRGVRGEEWRVGGEMRDIEDAARISRVLRERKESFISEVMKKGIRGRLVVGVGLMIAQNMVGLNALNYCKCCSWFFGILKTDFSDTDAPVIFMSAGFTSVSSSLFLTGVFGVVKLLSAIAFMFVFVKMKGNRFWLLLGSALCGASMLILGRPFSLVLHFNPVTNICEIAYFVHNLPPKDQLEDAKLTLGGVISVLTVYIFAFSFSVSLGPISWNVCSEVSYPSRLISRLN
jgi:hypothetical protein